MLEQYKQTRRDLGLCEG